MLAQTSLNKAYIFKEGAAATQARREREPAASLGKLLREAERGDAHAQYRYADACGGAEQLRWLNKSAAQGHRGALLKLGVLFQFGQGVPRSLVKAAEFFEKSIAAGEPSAYSNLGILYQKGEGGVPLDNEKAVALYREGARLGHMSAKMLLAQLLFIQRRRVGRPRRGRAARQRGLGHGPARRHLPCRLRVDGGPRGPPAGRGARHRRLREGRGGRARHVDAQPRHSAAAAGGAQRPRREQAARNQSPPQGRRGGRAGGCRGREAARHEGQHYLEDALIEGGPWAH
jgi:hypothetical protein